MDEPLSIGVTNPRRTKDLQKNRLTPLQRRDRALDDLAAKVATEQFFGRIADLVLQTDKDLFPVILKEPPKGAGDMSNP